MFQGSLEGIYVANHPEQPVLRTRLAHLEVGKGIRGDRYATGLGTFARPGIPDFEVTLIEQEALEAVSREYGFMLDVWETRRNLLTQAVPLNHLVNREFLVGNCRLLGIRLCEPCEHLQTRLEKPVVQALRHRGGLRAQVLQGGVLKEGDAIRPPSPALL